MSIIITILTAFGVFGGVLIFGIPLVKTIMLVGTKLIEDYERLRYGSK